MLKLKLSRRIPVLYGEHFSQLSFCIPANIFAIKFLIAIILNQLTEERFGVCQLAASSCNFARNQHCATNSLAKCRSLLVVFCRFLYLAFFERNFGNIVEH